MKSKIAVLLVLALAGCAVKPEYFTGPNGKAAYTMKCSGLMRKMADCYREAAKLCPAGYTVMAESHTGYSDGISRRLTVECK